MFVLVVVVFYVCVVVRYGFLNYIWYDYLEIFFWGECEGIEEFFVKENGVYLKIMIIVVKMVLNNVLKNDEIFC